MMFDGRIDELSVDDLTLNWAFSKQQFVRELDEIDKYKKVQFHEFLEFLCRVAWQREEKRTQDDSSSGLDEPLESSLWRLLVDLLGVINEDVSPPQQQSDEESESDFDDDIAENYLQALDESQIYSGYGPL